MKTFALLLIVLLAGLSCIKERNVYVLDIERPHMTLSLPLDAKRRVRKEYDAFLTYPGAFELNGFPKPVDWEKRGLGIFVEFAISSVEEDRAFVTFSFEDAEMKGWTTHKFGDHLVRTPVFGSCNMSSEDLVLFLGEWITFGDDRSGENGDQAWFKLRLRTTARLQDRPSNGS